MRIIHCADTHLGSRQYGSDQRRRDFLHAFDQVADLAIEHEVEAVIHAGDLFDSPRPGLSDVQGCVAVLQRLAQAGIPFLGTLGNHELRRDTQWIDVLASLNLAVHLGETPHEIGGWRFVGMDYAGRKPMEVQSSDAEVLVGHQLVDAAAPDAELTLEQCYQSGYSYVLLGDWHEHEVWDGSKYQVQSSRLQQDLEPTSHVELQHFELPLITYPGSTERCSSAERAPRGVNLIDLDTGELQHLTLNTRPFVYVESADDWASLQNSGQELREAVLAVRPEAGMPDIDEVEMWASEQGILRLQPLQAQEDGAATPEDIEFQLETPEFSDIIERELHPELSEAGVAIEQVIRDPEIADSQVDGRVTEMVSRD